MIYADRQFDGATDDSVNPTLLVTDGVSANRRLTTLPASDKIEALHISTVRLDDRQYISGLRVNDSADRLGYYHEYTTHTFRVDIARHGRIREIGFHVDKLGVRGLYPDTESDFITGIT
ncbi:hypothetical protein M432DRAFT_400266 [Thermoascus aurantiacus ATCC 26904]